jgi:hypothetical protein
MAKYGGEGTITMNVIISFDLDVGGDDLDDAHGEAAMWMESTADDIKLAILDAIAGDESVREVETKIGEPHIISLDDSAYNDYIYDSYRDREMLEGLDG